jgi:hypothetical protein
MLNSVLLAIGALPHESIRESSEPVSEAHNRLPHRPGWGASLSVKRHLPLLPKSLVRFGFRRRA